MVTIGSISDELSVRNSEKGPAWKYKYFKDTKDPSVVSCMFGDKTIKGAIYRAKQQVRNLKNAYA